MKTVIHDVRVPMIYNASLVRVTRERNFTYSFKSGKEKPSIIVPCEGELHYRFGDGREINVCRGDFLYVPAGLPYSATYLAIVTRIIVIHFDVASPAPFFFTSGIKLQFSPTR